MACCAAFLGSVLHQGGLSRPGHTHVRRLPWGQHTVGGALARRESIKGQVLRYWVFSQADQELRVAELWESSRNLAAGGCAWRGARRFNEGQKARAREKMKYRVRALVQPHLTGAFFWMWKSGSFLKSHSTIWRNRVLWGSSVWHPRPVPQKFWLIDLRAAPEICVYQSTSRWVLGLGNLGNTAA